MALQLIPIFILFLGNSLILESTSGRKITGNETDRLALIEFKKKIDLDMYGALSSWNDSIHFCNWVGITCGHRHQQRVISLNLHGKGLKGNISPSIGNLTFLHFLDIGNNSFHGIIPQEMGNLIRLQYISLRNNTLGGELPTRLANCTRLREIRFSRNNLVGKIPVELFSSSSKLKMVSINYNCLTGEIPDSIGNMSSIQSISMGSNSLQGSIPESFGQLTNLYVLSLFENRLSGKMPDSLYNLSSLESVYLAFNQLHGSLPQDIGLTLPNLKILAIAANNFSGTIPTSVSNISKLEIFDLGANGFTGPVPNNLGNLQNLRDFIISENQFGIGKADDLNFLSSLINCTQLECLGLIENGFEGPIPHIKANLSTQLSILVLGRNQIFGTIPSGIANLVNLTFLALDSNSLEGNIPPIIGKLPNLQRLFLDENRLSGQIPSLMGNLTLLYELHLDKNSLTGSIPSSIGNCQKLQFLTLSNNNFQGLIPKQLFFISSLSIYLDLSSNSLVGPLPIEIGNLKSLSTIDISNNRLSGEIPSFIGDCYSLEHLYMGGNFFEGEIPQTLTHLKGIQDLDLSHNNLSGKIPIDLQNLLALLNLNLSFNNFEGEVPTKGVFRNASAILVKGNGNLCGGIPELQLPTCINQETTKGGKSHALQIVLAIIGAVLGVLLISSFLTCHWMRKSKSKRPSTPLFDGKFKKISYNELFQMTGGFSSVNFIGCGSFGSVYKGIIGQYETFVAVKVLNLQNPGAYKSFMAECNALKNIRHRNLVKILTSCSSLDSNGNDFKALVYEFMPNGSLDNLLHPSKEAQNHSRNLSLLQRLNIAIDVASALDYLHHHCYAEIVHCDLKPSNILLDGNMTAHVSDFGLARLLLEAEDNSPQSQTSTIGIKGSIGYAAPEYGMGGKASIQGDVFSYGILLLEMFTGKRPTDHMFTDDLNLYNFAKLDLPTNVMHVLDPTLLHSDEQNEEIQEVVINEAEGPCYRIDHPQDCIISIFEIALQCSMESPQERMNMNNVVSRLHLIKKKFAEARRKMDEFNNATVTAT